MRLAIIRQTLAERELHFPTTAQTDKQSPWRDSIGDNKSFGGIDKKKLGKKKRKIIKAKTE